MVAKLIPAELSASRFLEKLRLVTHNEKRYNRQPL